MLGCGMETNAGMGKNVSKSKSTKWFDGAELTVPLFLLHKTSMLFQRALRIVMAPRICPMA
jgi:hypothetical protein